MNQQRDPDSYEHPYGNMLVVAKEVIGRTVFHNVFHRTTTVYRAPVRNHIGQNSSKPRGPDFRMTHALTTDGCLVLEIWRPGKETKKITRDFDRDFVAKFMQRRFGIQDTPIAP